MIVGLKQSVPHVIQAIPEVTITGEWLAEKISASLHSLAQTGFTVRGIVTDNHNSNANAFKSLKQKFDFSALLALLSEHEIEIAESTLDSSSEEVSTTIAGYIAKKLAKWSNCDSCKSLLIASSMDLAENHYLNLLSRGGLIVPSAKLAGYTSHCFAIMDYSYNIVQAHGVRDVRAAYTQTFDRLSPQIDICCLKHNNWGLKFAAKIVINTFF